MFEMLVFFQVCHVINTFNVSCLYITAQQQEQDPTNLYISNLPLSMDEQELETLLKPFGQVISTRILRDSNGTSRGVGFARSATSSRMNRSHNPTFLNAVFYSCD